MEKYGILSSAASISPQVVFANSCEKLRSDTYSLPFRHYYQSCSPICSRLEKWGYSKMADGLSIYKTNKVFCRNRHGKI